MRNLLRRRFRRVGDGSASAAPASAAGPAPLRRGEPLAPGYEAIELLRRGNDLDVYDAWSTERGTRCVLKVLRPDRLDRARSRDALIREGELLLRLTHPHIVRAYEVLTEPRPAIVLETLPGATLSYLIAEQPSPTAADLGQLGLQLGSALGYLHRNGYLHLDVKPSNVIVEAGRAKLLDLSVARPPGEIGAGIGTWQYLSPEQARGGHVGPAADVWGLGATLFETITGEPPFGDDPDARVTPPSASTATSTDPEPDQYPQLERRSRRVADLVEYDPAAAALVDSCLEPDPADRPPLPALMAALEELAALPAGERRWSRGGAAASSGHRAAPDRARGAGP